LTTRYLFFTGKGGVGKTSLACATALHLAESGRPVLIISTDPASNLDEVFGTSLSPTPQPVAGITNLWAANLDPEAAAAAYREKAVGPYRDKLPAAVIRNMEEQFSGACTTELAAFDQFVELLADDHGRFQHIVFDTAPTGHTLRLLSLPGAWSDYLNTTTAESSCLGPLAALKEKRALYASALTRLSDPAQTTLALVARPEPTSLREAARSAGELGTLQIRNLQLLINGVFPAGSSDPVGRAVYEQQQESLQAWPSELKRCRQQQIPLLGINVVGIGSLRALLEPSQPGPQAAELPGVPTGLQTLDELADDLFKTRPGVIMTMGKGGVGKTSVAIQIAQMLSERGARVRLTTTDPAGDLLERVGWSPNLHVDRIDPTQELQRYRGEVVAKASANLDANGVALLEEDLRSPCTEEIAVFRAFAEAVQPGQADFVVIDTAPTGHTILLMDATESYNREISRMQDGGGPDAVRELLPRLRDPNYTRVLLVTLPEPTPVHEARALQADLQRAGISSFAWVVNRSLLATGTRDPLLVARAVSEKVCLDELLALNERTVLEPMRLHALHS
jgi:arsenite/tail-anchored protein-transporting ATPase